MTDLASTSSLRERVRALMPEITRELETLVAIPSVSIAGYPESTHAGLAAAQQLQLALLPTAALLTKAGDVGVRFQSAETVSGDFYRVVLRDRNAVGVFVGDVASHGFAAALVMAHTL